MNERIASSSEAASAVLSLVFDANLYIQAGVGPHPPSANLSADLRESASFGRKSAFVGKVLKALDPLSATIDIGLGSLAIAA